MYKEDLALNDLECHKTKPKLLKSFNFFLVQLTYDLKISLSSINFLFCHPTSTLSLI